MNRKVRRPLIRALTIIVNCNAQLESTSDTEPAWLDAWHMRKAAEYEAMQAIMKYLGQDHSFEYCEKQLEQLVHRTSLSKPGEEQSTLIEKIVREWGDYQRQKSPTDWTFYVVVSNLELLTEFRLDGVELCPLTPDIYAQVMDKLRRSVDRTENWTQTQKDSYIHNMLLSWSWFNGSKAFDKTGNHALMTITFVGNDDPVSARQVAQVIAYEAIDFLRFLGVLSKGIQAKWSVGITGSIPPGGGIIIGWSDSHTLNSHIESFDFPLVINEKRRKTIDQFAPILCKTNCASDLENRIIQAIHWIGEAKATPSPEYRIVFLSTAMECLLTGRREEANKEMLSERFEALFPNDGSIDLRKLFRIAYKARSDFVHGNLRTLDALQSDLVSQFSLWAAIAVVQTVTLMQKHNWSNHHQFRQYLDQRSQDNPRQ